MKLLKFYATWCQPCKQIAASLANLDITHTSIDIEEQPEDALKYNIRGIPTLVIVDENNKEIARKVGALAEGKLVEWLNEYSFL